MGKITYFENQDYKIELENGKVFKVDDEQLSIYKRNLEFNYEESFESDDINNDNNFISWLSNIYNEIKTFRYIDANYKLEDSIKFNYFTFLGDDLINLNENSFKNLNFGTYDFHLYLYENSKNKYFKIGYFEINYYKKGLDIKGNTYFNKDEFIKDFIAPFYLSKKEGSLENFSFSLGNNK